MRRAACLLALIVFVLPVIGLCDEAKPIADDPALEKRVMALAENLRCLVCQNESIAGSHADLAVDLRNQIREQMRAGRSDEEIITYMTDRYGDFILFNPPVKATTYLLWFGPFVLLGVGFIVQYFYLKRRRKNVDSLPLSEAERKRIDALLSDG